jgi:hypothetical protein
LLEKQVLQVPITLQRHAHWVFNPALTSQRGMQDEVVPIFRTTG